MKQAHGVAWDYAEFSLEREEYLDEMWEKYKEDLAQPWLQKLEHSSVYLPRKKESKVLSWHYCWQWASVYPQFYTYFSFSEKLLMHSFSAGQPVSHHISRTLAWIVLQWKPKSRSGQSDTTPRPGLCWRSLDDIEKILDIQHLYFVRASLWVSVTKILCIHARCSSMCAIVEMEVSIAGERLAEKEAADSLWQLQLSIWRCRLIQQATGPLG